MERYAGTENSSKRLLENKLKKVDQCRDELVRKHYAHADKAGIAYESDEATGWLTPRLTEANTVEDDVILKIDAIESGLLQQRETNDRTAIENAKTNEIKVAKLQCDTSESALRERVTLMLELVQDETRSTVEDASKVRMYLNQVDNFME